MYKYNGRKSPPSVKTKRFIKKNKTVRRLVRARLERSLKKKMEEEMRVMKARQKDLRDFVLAKREDNRKIIVEEDQDDQEILTPAYHFGNNYWVYRMALFRGLKKSWLGFRIGKKLGEEGGDLIEQRLQKDYAVGIQEIVNNGLGLDFNQDFSRIGVFWDSKKKRSFVIKEDKNQYIEE